MAAVQTLKFWWAGADMQRSACLMTAQDNP